MEKDKRIQYLIKIILKTEDITEYRIAKDIGIRPATVSGWRKGFSAPKFEYLAKIAERYKDNAAVQDWFRETFSL